jgi:hypothetical protein
MPQEPADILGRRLFFNIKVNQAIPLMAQVTIVEIVIEREKSRSVQLVQERDYVIVFHALPAEVPANLADVMRMLRNKVRWLAGIFSSKTFMPAATSGHTQPHDPQRCAGQAQPLRQSRLW